MKRTISEDDYRFIAINNPTPFNAGKVLNDKIILANKYWFCLKNDYPYIEFDGYKVLEHLIITPRIDHYEQLEELEPSEALSLLNLIKSLNDKYSKTYENSFILYFWKYNNKSVKKFHLHFLVLEKQNGV